MADNDIAATKVWANREDMTSSALNAEFSNIRTKALDKSQEQEASGRITFSGGLIVDELLTIAAAGAGLVNVVDIRYDPASGTVADNDGMYLSWMYDDDAGNETEYMRYGMRAKDVSNGTEQAEFFLQVAENSDGALDEVLTVGESYLDLTSNQALTELRIDNTATDGDAALAWQLSGTSKFTMGVDDGDSDKLKIGTTAVGTGTWFEATGSLLTLSSQLTVGVNDTGYDVKFFGATSGAYMLWDESADDLVLAGAAGLDIAGDIDVDGTTNLDAVDIDGAVQIDATVTVGVDDTGYDVKFFGAAAGAFALWDESANLLEIRGATAAGPGHLKLTTGEATVVDGDILGRIDFQAPAETGTDAILVGASIWAEADDTFAADNNETELVFATGASETAAEKMRLTSDGKLGLGTDPDAKLSVSGDIDMVANDNRIDFDADNDSSIRCSADDVMKIELLSRDAVIFNGVASGTSHTFMDLDPIDVTLTDSAGAGYALIKTQSVTATLVGQTQVTSLMQGMVLRTNAITLAQSGGAVTVDEASALHVAAVVAGSSVTITKNSLISTDVAGCDLLSTGIWEVVGIDLVTNGNRIDLDADNDTSIRARIDDVITFEAGTTDTMEIHNGKVFIGDTANANMTIGLTISQAANDNQILTLKSSDVAHGVTLPGWETDDFCIFSKHSAEGGGVRITGISDAYSGAVTGIAFQPISGQAADTTKSTSGQGILHVKAVIKNGTDAGAPASDSNLMTIASYTSTRFIFDAEGSGHADVEWTTYGKHDDLSVIRDMEVELLAHEDASQTSRRHYMESTGIIGQDSWHMEDGKPRAMVNFSKLSMLHHGALIQIGDRFISNEERIDYQQEEIESLKKELRLLKEAE